MTGPTAATAQDDLQLGYAVVQLQLAALEVVRQAYTEHQRIGLPGTFGQYLLARRLVDEQGLVRARKRAAESAARASGRWSAVGQAGQPAGGKTTSGSQPRPVTGRMQRPGPQPALADSAVTLDYPGVLDPRKPGPPSRPGTGRPGPQGNPSVTLGFEGVLDPRQIPAARPASARLPAPPASEDEAPAITLDYSGVIDPRQAAGVKQQQPPPPPLGGSTMDYGMILPSPGPKPAPAPVAKTASGAAPRPAPKAVDPLEVSDASEPPSVLAIESILAAPPLTPAAGEDYSQDELSKKLAMVGPPLAPPSLEHSEDEFSVLPERPPPKDAPSGDGPPPSNPGFMADTRSGSDSGGMPQVKAPPVKKKLVDLVADPEEEFFARGEEDEKIGDAPQVGQKLGDFELTGILGQGGMGVVFEGKRRDAPGKRYAIKVLQPGEGDHHKARRVRFQREVETLRQLDHPNLVHVYGCGRRDGWDWYAMDYVEGRDLSKLLAEHRLSPQQKLEVFEKVCEGMAYAHGLRVVHRDLKPSNVRVSNEFEVRVLDFGLAKMEDEESEALTRTGAALGTPFYMAPEQFKNAAHVDARADVFALGVMLYEMITGKRPFSGATAAEVVEKVLNLEPPRLRQVVPNCPPAIEAICVKAMEKDAKRRYGSAAELLEDLVAHRKGKKVQTDGSLGDARRWMDKHGTGFIVGLLVASAVWGTALAWAVFYK